MQQAVEHFQQELAGVRTGRAHPGLLENLLVDADGDHVPIKACGSVTVRNPQLLAVVLFDTSVSHALDLLSGLGGAAPAPAAIAVPAGCSAMQCTVAMFRCSGPSRGC